ncbi:MAG: S-layer homology domain-containing protein, partial [Faecousia sp.]
LNAPATEVFQGGFLQLGVTLRPWCLENKNLTWTSSDETVAKVDNNGRVTGVSEGTATITVTTVASPELTQSVEITVKAPEFKVSFTGTGTDGLSRMATYDFGTRTLTKGAVLTDMEGNHITSAASDLGNYGSLWVQDQAEGEYRLHKIDPETGRSSFDSEISSTGTKAQPRLFNDISYDDGDSSTNDSEWIFATDGEGRIWCTQNREKPNTMMYVLEMEDDPINFIGITFGEAFDVDGTRFYPSYYLELSSNKLIMNNFSYSELMGWSSTYTYFALSEQLEYLTGANGRYLDTLTYDPATKSPILLHYNGSGYDVYWLSLDAAAKTATMLNLGTISGYTDVAGYTAEYYGTADNVENVALTALNTAGPDAAVPMKTVPGGSLNAVSTPGTEVVENTAYTTLTITAEEAAASGMITVELDENLEFVSMTSPVELNSYQQNGQTIIFGYAASMAVAKDSILAVLRLKQADAEATATVTETERGGETVSISRKTVFPYDSGTTYTLTYDVNGGKEANRTETQKSKDGSYTFTVSDFTPTKDGFSFLGWAEHAEASMPNYTKGSKITLTEAAASKTIYAVWKDFRTPAQNALENYYAALLKNNSYTDEGKAELASLLEEGLGKISESTTEQEAQKLLEKYKALMAQVSVKQPELEPERPAEPGTPVYVPGASGRNPFYDVSRSDWFYDDVMYVYVNDLMKGTDTTHFAPDGILTRGMVVTILYRMEEEPAARARGTFSDVALSDWYGKAVEWAAANGIVNGYSDGRFGPNDSITREQLAAILYRYAKYKGMDVSVGENTNILSYTDAAEVSEYAISAMQWACGEGLINGANGMLMPKSGATRAQVAAIIHRFLER